MKEKKKCLTCKKKPANNITNLQGEVDMNELMKAHNYLMRTSELDTEKLDLIEKVLNDLYPQRHPLNRSCRDCLIHAAKVITSEYKKRTN